MSKRDSILTKGTLDRKNKGEESHLDLIERESSILTEAKNFGFDVASIIDISETKNLEIELNQFLENKYHGEMDWLEKRKEYRSDPKKLWLEAKSILILGSNYHFNTNSLDLLNKKDTGIISVYARGRDYHLSIKKKLKAFSRWILDNHECQIKYFVDTAPVMEKPLAMQAGIGWQGKHTNIVSKEYGSWLFLSSIFLDIKLKANSESRDHCGTCNQCIDICPTNAIIAPYKIDAKKCISYLTIEHKSHIPKEYRKQIGNRIYGCDDCLAICPWNKYAKKTNDADFFPKNELIEPTLRSFLVLDDLEFRKNFSGSSIKRVGRDRFIRNVLVAVGNSNNQNFVKDIIPLLEDSSELVRAMAIWALRELSTKHDFEIQKNIYFSSETDIEVKNEWLELENQICVPN
ncbi:MAG: tRNA epoxyqueuosine(34) reductase QueG [Candidatus Pelagibacterales bacterium]|jgi:epoxyqueuosine reductase|tara:strand:- start:602 stop:1813 length:1212 start_codon:yes stop_codon:yes gene_type:complete